MNNTKEEKIIGLESLRAPFEKHQISKLPKPTKEQTEEVKADFKKGIRCKLCNGWHHPDVVHLDYVGHAALTDRLLDCDQKWSWEPVSFNEKGAPYTDANGGLWIKLTVCGVTRYGYGHPDGKSGGDALKESIGDALRNAAMRFGAALDLWHKGDLHSKNEEIDAVEHMEVKKEPEIKMMDREEFIVMQKLIKESLTEITLNLVIEKIQLADKRMNDAQRNTLRTICASTLRKLREPKNESV